MNDDSMLKKTLVWTGALLGLSAAWVLLLSLTSILVVSHVLPNEPATVTTPATPNAKPASSEPPSRTPPREDSPQKRRNG